MLDSLRLIKKYLYWYSKRLQLNRMDTHAIQGDPLPYQVGQYRTPIKKRSLDPTKNRMRYQNLDRAIHLLSGYTLRPGDYFSFWSCVPRPSEKTGFFPGPTLTPAGLVEDHGGGLCQVGSSIFEGLYRTYTPLIGPIRTPVHSDSVFWEVRCINDAGQFRWVSGSS